MYSADLTEIQKAKAITCLECCYALNMNIGGLDIELLYCRSIHTFKKILFNLVANKQNYISYDGIGRIHHIGRDLKLINWFASEGNFDDIEKLWTKCKLPIAIKIIPQKNEMFLKKSKYLDNVENHLVAVLDINNDIITFLEPILYEIITMKKSDFQRCYDNCYYYFERVENGDNVECLKDRSLKAFQEHIATIEVEYRGLPDDTVILKKINTFKDYTHIRDACSIFKVIGERSINYFKYMESLISEEWINNMRKLIFEQMSISNRLRMTAEYYRIKMKETPVVMDLVREMLKLDEICCQETIKLREEIYNEYNR